MRGRTSSMLLAALMASVAATAEQEPFHRRRDDEPRIGGKKTPGQMEARMRAAEEKRLRKNAKRLRSRA